MKKFLTPHVKAQLLRFLRLFVVALAAQVIVLVSAPLTVSVIVAAVVAAGEVAFRQVFPASGGSSPS